MVLIGITYNLVSRENRKNQIRFCCQFCNIFAGDKCKKLQYLRELELLKDGNVCKSFQLTKNEFQIFSFLLCYLVLHQFSLKLETDGSEWVTSNFIKAEIRWFNMKTAFFIETRKRWYYSMISNITVSNITFTFYKTCLSSFQEW